MLQNEFEKEWHQKFISELIQFSDHWLPFPVSRKMNLTSNRIESTFGVLKNYLVHKTQSLMIIAIYIYITTEMSTVEYTNKENYNLLNIIFSVEDYNPLEFFP